MNMELSILNRGAAGDVGRINTFVRDVRIIEQNGGTVPAAFEKALTRWEEWREESTPALQRLTDAYAQGTPIAKLAALRGEALVAEVGNGEQVARVRNAVAPLAYQALREAYQPVAQANYAQVQDAYNQAGQEFADLTEVVDPGTDAALLVSASEPVRKAWLQQQLTAQRLDALALVLATAASLAGHTVATDAARLGLLINTNDQHRRRVWEAFNSNDRCGRWSALIALGCTIEAPELDDATSYREPLPIEKRQVHNGIGVRMVDVDPEDADYTPAKRDPRDVLAV